MNKNVIFSLKLRMLRKEIFILLKRHFLTVATLHLYVIVIKIMFSISYFKSLRGYKGEKTLLILGKKGFYITTN